MRKLFVIFGICGLLTLAGCEVSDEKTPVPQATQTPAAPRVELARGDLKFVTDDLTEGLVIAEHEGKPLLVFFTARWCHFCHEMARESFTNRQVIALSHEFVCVLVDADAQPQSCQRYQVHSFPTVQFISPRGVPLNKIVGKRSSQDILQQMQAALQAVAAAQSRPDIQRL